MSAARVLTVRQPWASLTALGHKRIEIRTRPAKYRGTVLIQAGAHRPDHGETAGNWRWWREQFSGDDMLGKVGDLVGHPALLGAVVAVAELVDCLPIADRSAYPHPELADDHVCLNRLVALAWRKGGVQDISDQIPYCGGLLVPGNYAYLWADVRPLAEPIPHKGGPGLRHAPDDLYAAAMKQVA